MRFPETRKWTASHRAEKPPAPQTNSSGDQESQLRLPIDRHVFRPERAKGENKSGEKPDRI